VGVIRGADEIVIPLIVIEWSVLIPLSRRIADAEKREDDRPREVDGFVAFHQCAQCSEARAFSGAAELTA